MQNSLPSGSARTTHDASRCPTSARRAPSDETLDFCGLVDRTEVRMESVLACLLLRNRHEQQARHPIRSRPDLELVRGVAHDNPAQGLGPPSTKRDRIVSVDDDLLPNEIHVAHSARSVSQADLRATNSGPAMLVPVTAAGLAVAHRHRDPLLQQMN
jgi:hypothetical protein